MTDELQASRVYTDFQGLAQLRSRARDGSPDALEVAAKQFEAYMVQQLLRVSREANPDGGLFGDQGAGHYEDMFDKQMALSVTSGRGLGIADLLVRQLGGTGGAAAASGQASGGGATAAAEARLSAPSDNRPAPDPPRRAGQVPYPATPNWAAAQRGRLGTDSQPPAASDDTAKLASRVGGSATAAPTPVRFDSPDEFVAAIMPHAVRVGDELGVDPRLLVAQAALETGWGRSILRNEDGGSSHNLFNIKAHSAWDGPVAAARTREYLGGRETTVAAEFRSYDSFADSFRDYVDFLRSNPRYETALTQTNDPEAFARSLQAAGYATDPAYADKIMSIYGTERLASAVA